MARMVKLQSVLIVVLLALLVVPLHCSAAASYYREGDMWIYDVTEYSDSIVYSGQWNASYSGITTKMISGEMQDVHLFLSIWDFQVTGTFENASVTGSERIVDRQYTELDNYDTIMTESNNSMEWHLMYPPDTMVEIEGWMYNVSVYLPPGGTGDDQTYISVGDEWTNTYPIEYTTTEFDGFSTMEYSGYLERTIHYMVTGVETVTVPAGTFSCMVIREEYADGGATRWISNKVGSDVKIVALYESGEEFSAELTHYIFGARSDRPGSATALAASVVVAVAAAALVILLFLRKRRSEAGAMQKEGVYDPSKPPISPPGQIL